MSKQIRFLNTKDEIATSHAPLSETMAREITICGVLRLSLGQK